jgi:hypothetical protein
MFSQHTSTSDIQVQVFQIAHLLNTEKLDVENCVISFKSELDRYVCDITHTHTLEMRTYHHPAIR